MPIRLQRFQVQRLDLPLRNAFGIAGGSITHAANVLLQLELEDGTIGLGEAAPLPTYNGETQTQAEAVLHDALSQMSGPIGDDWREAAHRFHVLGGVQSGAAQCAFETALLDALSRQEHRALTQFFGGRGHRLSTDITITTGTVEEAAASAAALAAGGYPVIKLKIGGASGRAHDLERVAVVARAAPAARLILDGNASLDRARAAELAAGLRQLGIVPLLLEQWLPKDDLAGMRCLGQETGWRIAADEAVVTPADALRVAHAGAAHVINVKLMKAGVAAAWDVVEIARRSGLGLMIGGNVESSLGMTMSACFAAGLGGFEQADLDTPLFLAHDPFEGGLRYAGAEISIEHVASGHGVRLTA